MSPHTRQDTANQSPVHVRPAQPGDMCILLEPSRDDQIALLRGRQTAFMARCGGTPIKHIHLTTQRFVCEENARLQTFIAQLAQLITEIPPPSLTAIAIDQMHVPIREMTILKWRIDHSQRLCNYVAAVDTIMAQVGVQSLYVQGFVSSLVAALGNIPTANTEISKLSASCPYHLYDVGKIIVSRIEGKNQFSVLKALTWHTEVP